MLALKYEGVDVVVLTGQPNYPAGKTFAGYRWWHLGASSYEGIEVLRVPLFPRGKSSAIGLVCNYLSFIFFASVFGPWMLRGRRFDKILVFGLSPIIQALPAIFLSLIKKAKLLIWIQDLWPESLRASGYVRNESLLNAVAYLVRWIYRKSDILLVQSLSFVELVKSMSGGVPVRYHPNPGDFAFSTTPSEFDCPSFFDGRFSVVFTGNLGTVQSLPTILDAAEILMYDCQVVFILIGNGSRRSWLESEVKKRKLTNVLIPGSFPLSMMPTIMKCASVLLVSLTKDETISLTVPSKVQAYLAAGKPIIASLDGEGARVISDSGAGVVCPAEDCDCLASTIATLKKAPQEELARMGNKGKKYYERNFEPRFLAKKMVNEILSI